MIKTMTRLEELILFILDTAHKMGKENLSRLQIHKMIYMIQVLAIKYTGKEFIQGLNFIREKHGPISPYIYDSLKILIDRYKYVGVDVSKNQDYGFPRHGHKLIKNIPKLNFTDGEIIFLNSIISDLVPLTQKALKDMTYSTEPMKHILNREKRSGEMKGSQINLSLVMVDPDVVNCYSE